MDNQPENRLVVSRRMRNDAKVLDVGAVASIGARRGRG